MSETRHTLMREDVSIINARMYGATRSAATLQLALAAAGTDPATVLLIDEDDGLWSLETDVVIPPNVTLSVPAGVTMSGPGNLMVQGGIVALRAGWFQGPGVLTWDTSIPAYEVNQLHAGRLTLDIPLAVPSGGTGASTHPTHRLLLGNDTGPLVSAPALSNGQVLIGQTGQAPVAAGLTGTANRVLVTPGPGTITLSTPQDLHTGAVLQCATLGLGMAPTPERLSLAGALILGEAVGTTEGTMRFTGTDFEGRREGTWVSLTQGGEGGPSFLLMGA